MTMEQKGFDLAHGDSSQKKQAPVKCLGLTFDSDEARRNHFTEKLRKKLQDPEFRRIEGFPIGSDEDILALSDPPFYTACPNPFLTEFVACHRRTEHSEQQATPFASDVSVGRYAPESLAHSYHTKVPARAIARYLLHYTRPGDIVLDGFCGSGMTAVAAQLCTGHTLEAKSEIEADLPTAVWGPRYCIAVDLAPAATFIAANYLQAPVTPTLEQACDRAIAAVRDKTDWMFMTQVKHGQGKPRSTRIDHTVWSDVLICDNCGGDIVVWNTAVDADGNIDKSIMICPSCKKTLSTDDMERKFSTVFDNVQKKVIILPTSVPVLISYSDGNGRQKGDKSPDADDLALLDRIAKTAPHPSTPCYQMLFREGPWGDTYRSGYCSGTTHVHHFYRPRTLFGLAALRQAVLEPRVRWGTSMMLTATALKLTRMMRFMSDGIGRIQNGVIYFPSLSKETNPEHLLEIAKGQVLKLARSVTTDPRTAIISTSSATDLRGLPDDTVDYIFVDPPFGSNLQYSELNFIWESWLRVFTNAGPEAVVSNKQKKKLDDYTRLMKRSFREFFRVLKPGRWMTIEFHNSKNSVWNAIQEAITGAGFVVADVRVLDKKQGAFNQVVAASAVKKDLVISAYKPNGGLEVRFDSEAGTENGVWDFVRTHLGQLPVFVSTEGRAEVVAERQNFLLFDRMVAFHVQRGANVPVSAGDFYLGLTQRFSERDGMYFLPAQVAEYDSKRMTYREILQLKLFVTDEATAIQWLKQQLVRKPQTFQEIHPQFLKESGGWQKFEKSLELSVLLEQNFLRYDGKGPMPEQIHAYLSTNWKELRNLPKNDPTLVAKACDRWYVPDPNKAGDLEKLREKALLKEFEEYKKVNKKLKVFRLEAVRTGFMKAWKERDYTLIVTVADKIPSNVLEEDPQLLRLYDNALTRISGE